MIYVLTFSHPDYTVGFGIAPNLSQHQCDATTRGLGIQHYIQ